MSTQNPVKTRVAINGYGRIGRMIVRAFYEYQNQWPIEIIAINSTASLEATAHLTQYDTTHGKFAADIRTQSQSKSQQMIINHQPIHIFSTRDPTQLPWYDLNIDVVLECSGAFTSKAKAQLHLASGAQKVLISAPGADDVDATVVYGINHHTLTAQDGVVSNASCTTNALAPLLKPLDDQFNVIQGLMTTVHASTNDQSLIDSAHRDLRRARSASQNIIPTKTGAAQAIGLIMPHLAGKLSAISLRIPTLNVSLIDLSLNVEQEVSVASVNAALKAASLGELNGILAYNELPLVSSDFNHHSASAIIDASLTQVSGTLLKVFAWYDNEWGFSCRMLDSAVALMRANAAAQ